MTKAKDLFKRAIMVVDGYAADQMVRQLLSSGAAIERPVGDRGENAGPIKIGGDPFKAQTEVFGSNTADALAVRYVEETGDICATPREVVEKRLGIARGDFSRKSPNNSAVLKALEDVEVSYRGHIPKGAQPSCVTIDVRDRGVGVQPDRVAGTLCGLGGGNKTSTMYQAGAFGQGAKAPLNYANQEGDACQLIVTRHFLSNEITFTFIRRDRRLAVARTPIWNYLVDPKTNKPFTFTGSDKDFGVGTLVRTFDYPLGVGLSGKFHNGSVSLDAQVRRTLPTPLTPIMFVDKRTAGKGNKSWNRYLNSNKASFKYLGSLQKVNTDRAVRYKKTFKIDLGLNSSANMTVVVFNSDSPVDHTSKYVDFENPFLLLMNGQTHGEFSKHLLTRRVGYTALNKRFLAYVDVDGADLMTKNNLFSSTRESTMNTRELSELKSRIVKILASDPELEALNEEYRDANSSRTSEAEDELVRELLNLYIKSRNTSNPNGTKKKRAKSDNPTPRVPAPPIPVSDPPTMFELQGSNQIKVVKGKTFRLKVDTDADPALFENASVFLVDSPYSYLEFQGCSRNDGGHKTFTFHVSANAPEDAVATINLMLDLPNPLGCSVDVTVVAPEVKPPEDEGLPFVVTTVDNEDLLESLEMLRDDVSVLKVEAASKVIYINLLNPELQERIETYAEDGRYRDPEDLARRFKANYRAEATVTAWEVFSETEEPDVDIDLMELLIRRGSKSAFSTMCRTLKTANDLRGTTSN